MSAEFDQNLAEVESLLRATAASDHPLLAEAAMFLIEAGGKRFRPAVVIAASKLGEADVDRVTTCAAAIELMHLATLYHDDVIDGTDLRRGVDTAHRRYGNARAILVGDYLFARASGLAADLGTYVARRLADTIASLVDGQILESQLAFETGPDADGVQRRIPTVEEHLEVLRLKTGALIASSAHLGAFLAGCETDVLDAVTTYGEATGLAFQLADDLLDITAPSEVSGKQPGTDLKEGVPTLPAILTLNGDVGGGPALRSHLARHEIDDALELLRTNGSIAAVQDVVESQRARATRALERLPWSEGREALARLAGLAADRSA